VATALQPLRRIAAYGICTDPDDRVLLVRASAASGTPGIWSLPGGAVDHGEHPFDTVVRETAAETGLSVGVSQLVDVLADLRALPERGVAIHTDRLLYSVILRGGALRDRIGQPTDLARFVDRAELAKLALRPFTATALGLPAATMSAPPGRSSSAGIISASPGRSSLAGIISASPGGSSLAGTVDIRPEEPGGLPSFHAVPGPDGLPRAQRFAAYAVAKDPRGRVLLTRISPGYPGAGSWHLPGGGTDYGEQPGAALIRELVEETGQSGRLVSLIGVASHRDAASLGPEGYPIDWHGVRAFYRVDVDRPTRPKVHDQGGSTCAARWFRPAELTDLPLTEVTAEALPQSP
jgi:8-oxo-dGTP diphosphatase